MLRSIGYRTVPIEGVPFGPAASTLNNIAGQVVHPSTGEVATYQDWAGPRRPRAGHRRRPGPPRVKLTTVSEMLEVIHSVR